MLREHLYYGIKPYLPWRVRMGLRRIAARWKRRSCSRVWPIDESTARPPENWPGWPEGKKFAFVLTHDVEGKAGLEKCETLMAIDRDMGFRSAFNLIPEGEYAVPPSLREAIANRGCEVGVHDLTHDGKLFGSRRAFDRRATQVNHYLQAWGASGFRAGFMLRNLNWLHRLNCLYDSSTFDTDPFEPQSEGAGTIFPFWIPNPEGQGRPKNNHGGGVSEPDSGRRGYVELPYTLPQDSTLFIVLGETAPDIWMRKLDWIAEHGGMALLDVHPDYLRLENEPPSGRTYPIAYYRQFLRYVRERYGSAFWQPLPREMAEFVAGFKPQRAFHRPRRIAMITHSFYESDNRVARYAEALAQRGDCVEVFALRRSANLPREETIEGVKVYRIQDRLGKSQRSSLSYLWPMLRFLVRSSWWVTRRHARSRYDLLHIHNIPDFLVFAAWFPKLTGARIILDIHDIVPEFFASKFRREGHDTTFRMLVWMERVSAAVANHVIISNHLWQERYASRAGIKGHCSTFINNVDSSVFTRHERRRNDDRLVVLFPGGLQWHQGVDIAIRAFKQVHAVMPNVEFHIYGDGNARDSLVELTAELGLSGQVQFSEPVNMRQIAAIMADADLGVVPKRADSFGNEAYSTKIMEFMSVGVPVVASATKIDRYYFDDSIVRFFESGNPDSLAQEMLALLRDAELRRQITVRASEYAATHCWESRKTDYLSLVDQLLDSR
jgi:glycosyltransferase involved in cell wall biosynthesis/peptidoglycan/xylan/chitin deacetylase (PgdA/CDA1 family)